MSIIYLKEESNKKVLNLIRLHKHISGAELSRLTGLGRSMLVYILRALQDQGLIEKCGMGESTSKGGKKPTLWRLNPKLGVLIGAEVLKDRLRFISVTFDGNITAQETFPLDHDIDGNLCKIIESRYFQFVSNNRLNNKKILAVSIAVSGLVDPEKGDLVYSTTLNVSDVVMTEVLETKLNTKVYIINDANAGAMGVKWFPEDVESANSSIVYLTYNGSSKNIGCGIVIDNKLYVGASKTAGEILLPIPSFHELVKKGINKVGDKHAIYTKYKESSQPDIKEIWDEYIGGCPLSKFILEQISEFISNEIVRIVGFLNPELIVIGGEIALDESLLSDFVIPIVEKKIEKSLDKRVMIPGIKFSQHGNYSVAMGAIANIYADFM